MEIKENKFDVGRVTLNYAELPALGLPLVLLHGGSARWQSFDTILADLAATWHVYGWIANNLQQLDPDMLIATVDRVAVTMAGYAMERVLPAIA